MDNSELWILASRLAFAAVTTFLAIMLWSRTRDIAWMLIVFGVVAGYVDMIVDVFSALGLLDREWGSLWGIPFARMASENASYLFFVAAFVVALAGRGAHRSRKP